jgi:hypothetical protein
MEKLWYPSTAKKKVVINFRPTHIDALPMAKSFLPKITDKDNRGMYGYG